MRRATWMTLLLVFAVTAKQADAAPVQLISNGDFEDPLQFDWTVIDQPGSATWHLATPGATVPFVDLPTAPNPAGGRFYALAEGAGVSALLQTFVVPINATSANLSYQLFANDWPGLVLPGLPPSSIDFGFARVDILRAGADPLSVSSADLVKNFYNRNDPGTTVNPYTPYSFDVTALLTPGETYQLRFLRINGGGVFHLGVDNVSVLADDAPASPSPVPEPGTFVLMGMGGFGLVGGWYRKRRNAV